VSLPAFNVYRGKGADGLLNIQPSAATHDQGHRLKIPAQPGIPHVFARPGSEYFWTPSIKKIFQPPGNGTSTKNLHTQAYLIVKRALAP